jgi:tetratricopeptide (TPR) repeat protein
MKFKFKKQIFDFFNKHRFKALFFYSVFAASFFFITFGLSASTGKRSEQFQIGAEILSHILEVSGSDFLNPEKLKGKIILMIFASAEQEYSQKALQDLQSINDKFKTNNFKSIGIISSSKGSPQPQKYFKQHPLNYEVLYDKNDIADQLNIIVYPTTLIIDSEGQLFYYYALHTSEYNKTISNQLTRIFQNKSRNYMNNETAKKQIKDKIKNAQKKIKNGDVGIAMVTLTKLLQEGQDLFDIHFLLGYSYIKLKEPEKALFHFNKAKKLNPDSNQVNLGLGIAYSLAGKTKMAVSVLKGIHSNDPVAILAFRELSNIFEKKKLMDEALYYIKKELDILELQNEG